LGYVSHGFFLHIVALSILHIHFLSFYKMLFGISGRFW